MNCSTPGFPVHHQLPKSTQTYVRWVCDAIHPTISSSVVPFSFCRQSFPASGSFQLSQLFASGGQSIGVSASTSVLPMNTQDWWIVLKDIKQISRHLFQHLKKMTGKQTNEVEEFQIIYVETLPSRRYHVTPYDFRFRCKLTLYIWHPSRAQMQIK